MAFMACNGCEDERAQEPEDDPGMIEKMDRLVEEGISVLHAGVCRIQEDGLECERLGKILSMAEQRGIRVIKGTHRE